MQWAEFRSHVRHLPSTELARVQQAFDLGQLVHAGQKRLSGEPYFTHPVAVANLLADMGADADTIIAALLHDTVEDTPLTLDAIDRDFGGSVAALIDGVTKLTNTELPAKSMINEQTETLRKMFTLMEKDIRIMVIKLVDRMHNMQTITFLPPEKQRALAQETYDVYVKIADRICMQDIRDELEGLCLSVLEPEMYMQLTHLREQNEQETRRAISKMKKTIRASQADIGDVVEIDFEQATWERRRAQLEREGATATGQTPLHAVFICPTIDACYRMLGILHQHWQREILSFQDYINSPAINGYRGLHTTIIFSDGTRIRCKIRTREMHEYARHGISSVCFREDRSDLATYLPWTLRISPLAEDTKERSEEFWISLQSDILGKSIPIHGPDGQAVLVPKDSSALDAAFYLFGSLALRTKDIQINGKSVAFQQPLDRAVSVSVTLADDEQVHLSWLGPVRTGFASARIRQALAQRGSEEKIEMGQKILQEYLSEKNRGFLNEFSVTALDATLRDRGFGSLPETYTSLAEGRLSPQEVEQALFGKPPERTTSKVRSFTLRCTVPVARRPAFMEMLQSFNVRSVRVRDSGMYRVYRIGLKLTDVQRRALLQTALQSFPSSNCSLERSASGYLMAAGILLLFVNWGLDPVFAHVLLNATNILPTDLTIIRFWSLTAISGALLASTIARSQLRETRLPLGSKSLWVSVALLLCVALSTYLSLENTLPSHYTIPMTAAGLLLTSIVNRKRLFLLAISWLCVGIACVTLILATPGWTPFDMLATLAAVMSFTAFSLVSERYKRKENVASRAAQYFFVLSFLCAIATLPLLAQTQIPQLGSNALGAAILFSIFSAGLPYYIYYFLLSHKEIDFVLRFSFFIIPATLLGQALLIGLPSLLILFAGALVMIGAALPMLNIRRLSSFGEQ